MLPEYSVLQVPKWVLGPGLCVTRTGQVLAWKRVWRCACFLWPVGDNSSQRKASSCSPQMAWSPLNDQIGSVAPDLGLLIPNHWYDMLVCKGAERLRWSIEGWAPITWRCSDGQWRFSYSFPERREITKLSHSLTLPIPLCGTWSWQC